MPAKLRAKLVNLENASKNLNSKVHLDQTRSQEQGELSSCSNQLDICANKISRAGWDAEFALMAQAGDDRLLDLNLPTEWEETEWQ